MNKIILVALVAVIASCSTKAPPKAGGPQEPEAKAPSMDVKEDRVILTLSKDEKIFIGKTEIPRKVLREKLVANVKLQRDKEIYLHADRALAYGFVVDVMAVIKEAGVDSLGMVTDPISRK